MEKRIYIGLPEEEARKKMFKIHLGNTPNDMTEEQFEELARRSQHYSSSDIKVAVKSALMQPVRECQTATHFMESDLDQMLVPCSPNAPGAMRMSLFAVEPGVREVPADRLRPPQVTYQHFIDVLTSSKASVGQSELRRFEEWTAEFGEVDNKGAPGSAGGLALTAANLKLDTEKVRDKERSLAPPSPSPLIGISRFILEYVSVCVVCVVCVV